MTVWAERIELFWLSCRHRRRTEWPSRDGAGRLAVAVASSLGVDWDLGLLRGRDGRADNNEGVHFKSERACFGVFEKIEGE